MVPSKGLSTSFYPQQHLIQTGGRRVRWQSASAGGWVANIDSMSAVLGEKRGQRRFSYKANSRPISSHVLSGDFFTFSPLFFSSRFELHLFSRSFYSDKSKRGEKAKKTKKKQKQGRQRLSSERSTQVGGGAQIALQKTGLRAQMSHNAADKKVGHITFGGHVTGMRGRMAPRSG